MEKTTLGKRWEHSASSQLPMDFCHFLHFLGLLLAVLNLFGVIRGSCPAEGVKEAVAAARLEYEAQGAPEALQLHFEPKTGHEVTRGMWTRVDAFFVQHLSQHQEKADL